MGASYFSSSFLFDILGADASGPGAGTVGVRRGMTHRARCATRLAHLFATDRRAVGFLHGRDAEVHQFAPKLLPLKWYFSLAQFKY